ncbi:phosphotransacetylase family protein [Haloglomus salinum]|jgi:BioD-like phosphotransacetylase family protein|uniref:phosphotransacetylase family protein n=1 Tax=Haloglomus salinum TaxID=2962673 RepID=UPI0020C93CDA|nr:phosphotransacetylase family protein [Haloglomus salinum]
MSEHDDTSDERTETEPSATTDTDGHGDGDQAAETLLVTSTADSTGKTAVALALALAARDGGKSVGYMKPKGTRLESNVGKTLDADPMLARELLDLDDPMHELEPVVYSPTFVREAVRGREDPAALRETVREAFADLAAGRDLLLVEGGGLNAGATVGLTDPEVADLLDARVLLVAPYSGPEDIDDVLVASERFGDRLSGVLFNAVGDAAFDDLASDVVPFLSGRGVRTFGTLPRVKELAGVAVADLGQELGARTLTDGAPTDAIVERFVVGAMSAGEALPALRRTRSAVLVSGGDRPEIVTAALDASGIEAVLLTGGFQPPAAVLGRAEEAGVPVLLVQADTTTAIERLEGVIRSGRARDARTVERMGDLLAEYADVDAMLLGTGG